jgi:hypothetical protein
MRESAATVVVGAVGSERLAAAGRKSTSKIAVEFGPIGQRKTHLKVFVNS